MPSDSTRRKALRTSKNAIMLFAGMMVRMTASFGFVLYSARLLGLEGFGRYSIAMHYFELSLSLCATGIGIILTRDVARWARNSDHLISGAILLACILCCIAPLILLPLGVLLRYSQETLLAMAVGCLALPPSAVALVLEAAFVAKERAAIVTLGTSIESLIRIVACFVVLWIGYGVVELMFVMVAARSLQLVVYVAILRHSVGWRWEWQWASFRRFVWRWRVFAAENWLATIYTSLDVVVLSFVSGPPAVALYSASQKFVRLGSVIARSYTTAIYPVMSRMYAESKESFARLFRHTIRVQCMLALPICTGVTVLAERLVTLLYSEQYSGAAPVLRVSIWVLLLTFINPFLSHVLFAQGRQHRSMFVAAISLAWNVIATYLLIYYFDAVGAAMSCVIGGFLATIFYVLFSMSRGEVMHTIGIMSRVMLAAVGMGGVTYLLRHASWPAVLAASASVYVILLFVVQVLRFKDFRFFRTTFLGRAAT